MQKLATIFQRRTAFAPTMGWEAETLSAFSNTANREARQISATQPKWLGLGTPSSCEMVGSFSNLREISPQISSDESFSLPPLDMRLKLCQLLVVASIANPAKFQPLSLRSWGSAQHPHMKQGGHFLPETSHKFPAKNRFRPHHGMQG